MMQAPESFLAECDIHIGAPPERVFEYFVDAEKLVRWKGVSAELDPRPGGIYKVEVAPGWLALGEFQVVDRPRFLSFTFGWEGEDTPVAPGSTLVEVTFEPRDGGTTVQLRHSALPSEDALASHREGWEHFLGRLAIVAAGGDAGPDPWIAE